MKVLLADEDPARARTLARTLAADGAVRVVRLESGETLAAAVAAHAPDVVIVDMARPDRDALDGVRQVSASMPRPIVLFVDEDDPAFMEAAIAAGVCSYNAAGVPPPDVKPMLRAATALFRRHQQMQDDLQQSTARLQERALIDRAKALLIRSRRLSEPQAYRWLQRQAMARGRRIAEIAGEVVREGSP